MQQELARTGPQQRANQQYLCLIPVSETSGLVPDPCSDRPLGGTESLTSTLCPLPPLARPQGRALPLGEIISLKHAEICIPWAMHFPCFLHWGWAPQLAGNMLPTVLWPTKLYVGQM